MEETPDLSEIKNKTPHFNIKMCWLSNPSVVIKSVDSSSGGTSLLGWESLTHHLLVVSS